MANPSTTKIMKGPNKEFTNSGGNELFEPRRSARIQKAGDKIRWNCCPDHYESKKSGKHVHHNSNNTSPKVNKKKTIKSETMIKSPISSPKKSSTNKVARYNKSRKTYSKKSPSEVNPMRDDCNLPVDASNELNEEMIFTEPVIEETVIVENFINDNVNMDNNGSVLIQRIETVKSKYAEVSEHCVLGKDVTKSPSINDSCTDVKNINVIDVKPPPCQNLKCVDKSSPIVNDDKQPEVFQRTSSPKNTKPDHIDYSQGLLADSLLDNGNVVIFSDIDAHVHEEVYADESYDECNVSLDHSSNVLVDSGTPGMLFDQQQSPENYTATSDHSDIEEDGNLKKSPVISVSSNDLTEQPSKLNSVLECEENIITKPDMHEIGSNVRKSLIDKTQESVIKSVNPKRSKTVSELKLASREKLKHFLRKPYHDSDNFNTAEHEYCGSELLKSQDLVENSNLKTISDHNGAIALNIVREKLEDNVIRTKNIFEECDSISKDNCLVVSGKVDTANESIKFSEPSEVGYSTLCNNSTVPVKKDADKIDTPFSSSNSNIPSPCFDSQALTLEDNNFSMANDIIKENIESVIDINVPTEGDDISILSAKTVVIDKEDSEGFMCDGDKSENETLLVQSKPEKVKSRWRRSIEMEMLSSQHKENINKEPVHANESISNKALGLEKSKKLAEEEASLEKTKEIYDKFEIIEENISLGSKKKMKNIKESRRMVCDCTLSKAEINGGMRGCGEDCLNRLLLIECGSRCPCGSYCSNKRFQNHEFYPCELFQTEKKGLGLRALSEIPSGAFIMEYVGEVLEPRDFQKRSKAVAKSKQKHFYFMALTADKVIDATFRGNISRYINHSCDPNAETQKWTVNGELRIGFFSIKRIKAGDEITFNYQYQRYGKEAQKCYCESDNCCGWIGGNPKEEEERRSKAKKDKDGKKRREDRKQELKDYLDDMDLDMEIDKLCASGLKNRDHTLTLSRLMVRAEDNDSRLTLLRLLQSADIPCRRLFLDYHGLKLIWSWMVDMLPIESNDIVKKEILVTLSELPIPHKTMLVESKILSVVEKWSGDLKSMDTTNMSEGKIDTSEDDNLDLYNIHSCVEDEKIIDTSDLKDKDVISSDILNEESELNDSLTVRNENNATNEEITQLSAKLLDSWSSLKELFKIPKMKERLESRKEHEREADEVSGVKIEIKSYKDFNTGKMKPREKGMRFARHIPRIETDRSKRSIDKRFIRNRIFSNLSKEERRHLFECKVAEEEKGRRLKVWGQQKDNQNPITDSEHFDAKNYFFQSWDSCKNSPGLGTEIKSNITTPSNLIVIEPENQTSPLIPGSLSNSHNSNVTSNPGNFTLNVQWPFQSSQNNVSASKDLQKDGYSSSRFLPNFGIPGSENESSNNINSNLSNNSIPPCKLPPKWRMHQDSRGYVYYYHKKLRIPQWEPPSWEEEIEEEMEVTDSEESSDSSNGDSSSSGSETEHDEDGTTGTRAPTKRDLLVQEHIISPRSSDAESNDTELEIDTDIDKKVPKLSFSSKIHSPPPDLLSQDEIQPNIPTKRKEINIDELDIKKPKVESNFKLTNLSGTITDPPQPVPPPTYISLKPLPEKFLTVQHLGAPAHSTNSPQLNTFEKSMNKYDKRLAGKSKKVQGELKRKKDKFRAKISSIIVQTLNPYRKPTCKKARITNTEDFKHLARKLTHFVLLKELKHCKHIDELTVTDSVKHKAKDFVKKYMLKFSEVYVSSPKRTE